MWGKDEAICLEDWKVCLEEAEGAEPDKRSETTGMEEERRIFLCLNEDRAYCFEDLLTDEKSVWAEWKYISQEITKEQPSLIHVRANYTCHGSPWSVYLVISYRLPEADQIELVKASRSFVLLETANSYWSPGEKKFPDCFLDKELCLCNGGQKDLYIRGIAGERGLRPGEEMIIKMDEILL